MSPLVDGASFILDAPEHVPAVWGTGNEVLWSQGEPLLLCGPPGVGKSTLIQQVVRARMGGPVSELEVLGHMVTPDPDRRVLYVAADRPSQIRRSLRRMFTEPQREHITSHFAAWRGPLDFSLVDEPWRLRDLAIAEGAGTVIIDSLKDVASPLSEDRVGGSVKAALTALTESGIEVCALHHQRKGQAENKRPTKLDDVYGSAWITAGAGSVVLLNGTAGEPLVELLHLKQPADEVGPLKVLHDHEAGRSSVVEQVDAYALLQLHGSLTAKEAARLLFGDDGPGQVEKARRKLQDLVTRGHAERADGATTNAPTTYRTVRDREGQREPLTLIHGDSRSGSTEPHATLTDPHDQSRSAHTPVGGGGRVTDREAPSCAIYPEGRCS